MGASGGAAATEEPTATPIPAISTPAPPPTATQIPYNLTVIVTDQDGDPIPGAFVQTREQEVTTAEDGTAVFADLSEPAGTLTIDAPGYISSELSGSIERGDNQIHIVLEKDPTGLSAKYACAPGETHLYLDDFQEGEAQGW